MDLKAYVNGCIGIVCSFVITSVAAPIAAGQPITFHGGPTFGAPTFSTGDGFRGPIILGNMVLSEQGVVVARYEATPTGSASRLVRWSASGIEILQNLATTTGGTSGQSVLVAIDDSGAVYGNSTAYIPSLGNASPFRAVRWAPGTTIPTE